MQKAIPCLFMPSIPAELRQHAGGRRALTRGEVMAQGSVWMAQPELAAAE